MITVTNEMRCGKVEYTTGNVKIEGEFKINPANKVERIDSGTVTDSDGMYLGSFNAYMNGEEFKVNINDMQASLASTVAVSINEVVTELEEKYNV